MEMPVPEQAACQGVASEYWRFGPAGPPRRRGCGQGRRKVAVSGRPLPRGSCRRARYCEPRHTSARRSAAAWPMAHSLLPLSPVSSNSR